MGGGKTVQPYDHALHSLLELKQIISWWVG